jgi:hypothetical protein
MSLIKLKDAVSLYSQESDAQVNSYGWYRKSAQRSGTVYIGGMEIPVHKEGSVWYLNKTSLKKAVEHHLKEIRDIKQITVDYENGIIHGNNGDRFQTTWGGYEIRGQFRLAWSAMERYRKRSYGTWYCNSCNTIAGTKHDKPEYHLCNDWNGCNEDCTLSEVYCEKCGYRVKI